MSDMIVLKGTALWAKIFQPDNRFVKPHGEYSTQVLVPEAEAAEVCEQLEAMVDAKFAEVVKDKPALKATLSKRPVTEPHVDDRTGEPTGNLVFKSKCLAVVESKTGQTYAQKPSVVDSKRQPMAGNQLVGNGSTIKVAVEPIPYYMASTKQVGVSLRLKAVQVIDLKEHNKSASSIFDDEDGFVAEAVQKDDAADVFDDHDTSSAGADEGDF
jgi:lactam utilization protein B